VGDLLRREVGHQRLDVVDAVVDHPYRSGGEAAVAAGFLLRRRLQHQHLGALLLRRERRAERRIAAADDDDIRFQLRHATLLRHPHSVLYSAATTATPPCAFDQPPGSCMNFSTSASLPASNLPLALATASTSPQVASECRGTARSPRIFCDSGKMS